MSSLAKSKLAAKPGKKSGLSPPELLGLCRQAWRSGTPAANRVVIRVVAAHLLNSAMGREFVDQHEENRGGPCR